MREIMFDPIFLRVLRKIKTRLDNTGVKWVITGSFSFALQGIPVIPADIDIQTDRKGAYEIERCFADCVVKKV